MRQSLLILLLGIALGMAVTAAAYHMEDGESLRQIANLDIQEQIDGNSMRVSAVEVTLGPGKSGLPHRHPGPGFVYVLEGEYELGIDDQPTKRYREGEIFYEPTGCLHRVSKNPSKSSTTRLIAFILHPRDSKEIAVPETSKK